MPTARIIGKSHLDGLTLTITSEAGDFVKGHLLDFQPGRRWRSTTAAAQTIDADCAEPLAFSGFVLYDHNLSGTATIRIQIASDPAYTALLYDLTFDALEPFYGLGEGPLGMEGLGGFLTLNDAEKFSVHWFTTAGSTDGNLPVIGRYVRVVITDTANTDGYVEAGRIKMADYFDTQTNIARDYQLGYQDDSELSRTRGGALRSNNRVPYRVTSMQWEHLNDIEKAALLELVRQIGKRGDVFVSAYPEEGTTRELMASILGRITEHTLVEHYMEVNNGGVFESRSRGGIVIEETK